MIPENFEEAPRQRFARIRKLLPKRSQPFLRGLRKRSKRPFLKLQEPFYSVYPYTQVHPLRQENLLRLALESESHNVPGAIVECGVLDGGTAALMAQATSGSGRDVHLFDSWQGLPTTTEKDGEAAAVWTGEDIGSPNRVISIMKRLDVDLKRLRLHKGWFHETFPNVEIPKIALLHIDADLYESVKICLEKWVPSLAPGGYVQIDDYAAFVGCRRAVDEFLAPRPELKLQTIGAHTKAYFFQTPALADR